MPRTLSIVPENKSFYVDFTHGMTIVGSNFKLNSAIP